jgi:hypothetical protein
MTREKKNLLDFNYLMQELHYTEVVREIFGKFVAHHIRLPLGGVFNSYMATDADNAIVLQNGEILNEEYEAYLQTFFVTSVRLFEFLLGEQSEKLIISKSIKDAINILTVFGYEVKITDGGEKFSLAYKQPLSSEEIENKFSIENLEIITRGNTKIMEDMLAVNFNTSISPEDFVLFREDAKGTAYGKEDYKRNLLNQLLKVGDFYKELCGIDINATYFANFQGDYPEMSLETKLAIFDMCFAEAAIEEIATKLQAGVSNITFIPEEREFLSVLLRTTKEASILFYVVIKMHKEYLLLQQASLI